MTIDYKRTKQFWEMRADSSLDRRQAFNLGTSAEQHNVQMAYIMAHVSTGGETAIDLGCGHGRITIPLARLYAKVIAVDFSEKVLDALRRSLEEQGIKNVVPLCANSFDRLPLEDNANDLVVISGVFSGLNDNDMTKTIANARRLLNDRGMVIVRESVGMGNRFEIDKYSEELQMHYCAIYRTADAIEAEFRAAGCKAAASQLLYQQRKETGTWFWVFRP